MAKLDLFVCFAARPVTRRGPRSSADQQGAALMVSMVMIFIMSLLGVSVMRSGTLGGRMVSNAFEKDLTFQAAESATDFIIDDDTNLLSVICTTTVHTSDVDTLESGSKLQTTVDVTYGGQSVPSGFSIDGGFSIVRFTATGTSTLTASNTTSRVSQGVYMIGAQGTSGGC
jgi:type IV pilus assembly protein PilX